MRWLIWFERNAARDFCVGPDLALEGLDVKDVVLEEHWVFINRLPDTFKFARQSCNGFLLSAFSLLIKFVFVV